VNITYAHVLKSETRHLGHFAERVVMSATALKFAFLKESLTSACFSLQKNTLHVPFSSQRQNRTVAPEAVRPWPNDVISWWLPFFICKIRNSVFKVDNVCSDPTLEQFLEQHSAYRKVLYINCCYFYLQTKTSPLG
jgi:hypothetical protein